MKHKRLAAALCALAFTACERQSADAPPTLWEGVDGAGTRRFASIEWDTLWTIGGEQDTVIGSPSFPRAKGDTLILVDRAVKRLLAVGKNGDILWIAGREGSGPGEYKNIRDIQITGAGDVAVNDPENGRITILDSQGHVRREIASSMVPRAEVFAPIAETLALVTVAPEQPLRILDYSGVEKSRLDMPWEQFGSLSLIIKQGIVAVDGDRWVYLFGQGNGWFAFRAAKPEVGAGRFVEHAAFPVVVTTQTRSQQSRRMLQPRPCTACSATLRGDTLYVHFGGRSQEAFRVLDVYTVSDSAYQYSIQLPTVAEAVEVGPGGRVHLVRTDPFPQIITVKHRGIVPEEDR